MSSGRCYLLLTPLSSGSAPWERSLTLAMGAKQLVVQEALDTTSMVLLSYFSLFTPITNMGASLDGALMTTCLQERVSGCSHLSAASLNQAT